MRISDWSSDVCSSDLLVQQRDRAVGDARDALVVQRRLEVVGVDVVVELLHVGDELIAECRALLGGRGRPVLPRGGLAVGVERVLRRHPQVLLDPVEPGPVQALGDGVDLAVRSEEHTSELQSLMRISYAVFCLKKKTKQKKK